MHQFCVLIFLTAVFTYSNVYSSQVSESDHTSYNMVDHLNPLGLGSCDLLFSYAGPVPAAAMHSLGEFAQSTMISAVKLPTIEYPDGTYAAALTFDSNGSPFTTRKKPGFSKRGDRHVLIYLQAGRENLTFCSPDANLSDARVEISPKLFSAILETWQSVLLNTHYDLPPKASVGRVGGGSYTFISSSDDFYRIAGSVDNPDGGLVYDLINIAHTLTGIAKSNKIPDAKTEGGLIRRLEVVAEKSRKFKLRALQK